MWFFKSFRTPPPDTALTAIRKRTALAPWKWNFDSPNPETLSLLKAGHMIILDQRHAICGTEHDTISLVDLDCTCNLQEFEEVIFEGITHESLTSCMLVVKNRRKCTPKPKTSL